jgi:hypothetical protein
MCEAYGTINTRPTLNGTQYDLTSSATFLIKLQRYYEDWKIISLECVYDKDNLIPVINPPAEPLNISFPRESYKCLAYVLENTGGYKVDLDLPGWDNPEEAQKHIQESRNWVHPK